jgi:ABC-type multidrug transport system fused ATPase/permease subunit
MKSLRYINKYFVKYKWRFLFGILFTVVSNYFGVQMPAFFSSAIDQFQEQINQPTIYGWPSSSAPFTWASPYLRASFYS